LEKERHGNLGVCHPVMRVVVVAAAPFLFLGRNGKK
jgi:hypothetical protein